MERHRCGFMIMTSETAMLLGLRTVIYSAPDLNRARAWYSAFLGFAPYFDEPDVGGDIRVATVADPDGNQIGLIENPNFRLSAV